MAFVPPKFRKLQKPKAIMAIGTIHLGADDLILKTLSAKAKLHDAQVYHLGNVCSDLEKIMHARRIGKVRTFEKMAEQKIETLDKAVKRFDRKNDVSGYNRTVDEWNRFDARAKAEKAKLEGEVLELENAEALRVDKLIAAFPGIKFIANREQYINESSFRGRLVGNSLAVSKFMSLQSLPANGPRVSTQPVTDRAFNYMKTLKTSLVCPHPSPACRSFQREGLNHSWEIYTTGALQYMDEANRPIDFHRAVNLPSAMMLFIDKHNGEYHSKRIHIDSVSCKVGKIPRPAILDDGLVTTSAVTWEVPGADLLSITSDMHAPHENRGVVACARTQTAVLKPETVLDNGDLVDCESANPHATGKPLHVEGLRFVDDEKAMARLAKALGDNPCIKERVAIDSNHPRWMDRLVEKLPMLKGLLDQVTVFARAMPDWKITIPKAGADYTYYFGDLAFRHGDCNNGSLMSALKVWRKIYLGHWHRKDEFGRGGTSGAGCNLGPAYLSNGVTSWTNTIASATRCQGKTNFNTKVVLHSEKRQVSRVEIRGEIYEVEWHKYPGE